MIQIFIKYMFLLAGAIFLMNGWEYATQLREMLVSGEAYQQTAGTVLSVQRQVDGAHTEFVQTVYALEFAYRVDRKNYTARAISPVCEACLAEEVRRITGAMPDRLAAGAPVTVYVSREHPQVAYLALATRRQLIWQWWMVLLTLVIAPAALYGLSRVDWSETDYDES